MIIRFFRLLSPNPMCVIEAYQPLATRTMKGQGIINSVWLLWRNRYPCNYETHPVFTSSIDDKHLAIEIKQQIERWIARPSHPS